MNWTSLAIVAIQPNAATFPLRVSASVWSFFLKQVASKREKPRKPVTRVNIVLDHVERKIIETAKGPHGNDDEKARLRYGMFEEQKSRRQQP